jgi:hypothetical protein
VYAPHYGRINDWSSQLLGTKIRRRGECLNLYRSYRPPCNLPWHLIISVSANLWKRRVVALSTRAKAARNRKESVSNRTLT